MVLCCAIIVIALFCFGLFAYLEPVPDWQFTTLDERLKEQVRMQWRWASVYGVVDLTLTILGWACAAALLGISTYYTRVTEEAQKIAKLWIAILTALAVSIPLLLNTLDIRSQQRVYTHAAVTFDAMWCRLHYSRASGGEAEKLKAEILADYIRFRASITEHLTYDVKAANPTTELNPKEEK